MKGTSPQRNTGTPDWGKNCEHYHRVLYPAGYRVYRILCDAVQAADPGGTGEENGGSRKCGYGLRENTGVRPGRVRGMRTGRGGTAMSVSRNNGLLAE